MSFFGIQTSQSNQTTEVEPRTIVDPPEDNREELPGLPKRRSATVIAKGITLSGTLKGQGVVEVEGTVEGELDMKGSVVVTSSGVVNGPVKADVIRIAGRVVGNISAMEHLLLETTGSIEGDVSTNALVVENGGSLNGRTTMLPSTDSSNKGRDTSSSMDKLQFGPDFKLTEEENPAPAPAQSSKSSNSKKG
jgi:cytoskeletal protein CcmA (bactofilin family)